MSEPARFEHVRADQLGKIDAGHRHGHQRGQADAGITVVLAGSRLEAQRIGVAMRHLLDPACLGLEELAQILRFIRESGGVGKQMPQRDVLSPIPGELGEHSTDLRAEREEALFDEGDDHRGGVELGNRGEGPERLL